MNLNNIVDLSHILSDNDREYWRTLVKEIHNHKQNYARVIMIMYALPAVNYDREVHTRALDNVDEQRFIEKVYFMVLLGVGLRRHSVELLKLKLVCERLMIR